MKDFKEKWPCYGGVKEEGKQKFLSFCVKLTSYTFCNQVSD
jgi:hypothetical protein